MQVDFFRFCITRGKDRLRKYFNLQIKFNPANLYCVYNCLNRLFNSNFNCNTKFFIFIEKSVIILLFGSNKFQGKSKLFLGQLAQNIDFYKIYDRINANCVG